MTKKFTKTVSAMAVVFATMISSNVIVSAAEVSNAGSDTVKVIVDGNVQYFNADKSSTVGDLLASNNIVVTDSTDVSVDLNNSVADSKEIVVAQPKTVIVSVDGGKAQSSTTSASNLGAFHAEYQKENTTEKYTLASQTASTPLSEGMYIQLSTIREVSVDTYEAIPYETKEVKTDSLYVGEKKVVTAGVDGVKTTTTTTKYVGDQVTSTDSVTKVTKEPVTEVINVGTKAKPAPVVKPAATTTTNTIPGLSVKYKKAMTLNATAYCPCSKCCGSYSNGYTASGMKAGYGVAAVDTRVIPLGTKLYVEGYGYCIAADTGGAIKGNRIDLCYGTHSAALSSGFGHKNVKVYIIG